MSQLSNRKMIISYFQPSFLYGLNTVNLNKGDLDHIEISYRSVIKHISKPLGGEMASKSGPAVQKDYSCLWRCILAEGSQITNNMENMLIKLVFHEIDIIIQKQIMIVKINAEVEDRRVRLMEVNQSSEELQLSSETRKNILENVSNMEMENHKGV